MGDRFRAFIAMPLPEAARDALVAMQKRLAPLAEGHRVSARWTEPENLHVTMKFLGYVPEAHRLRYALIVARAAAQQAPIDATLRTAGAFGSPRRARILHAAIEDPEARLGELAAVLEDEAHALGVAREGRTFKPHVTLARVKVPSDVTPLLAAAALTPMPVRFGALQLYESRPSSRGSRYIVVAESAFPGT